MGIMVPDIINLMDVCHSGEARGILSHPECSSEDVSSVRLGKAAVRAAEIIIRCRQKKRRTKRR